MSNRYNCKMETTTGTFGEQETTASTNSKYEHGCYPLLSEDHRHIMKAIESSDVSKLQTALSEYGDSVGSYDLSIVLLWTVKTSQHEMTNLLLERGANIGSCDQLSDLLSMAIKRGNMNMFQVLLTHSKKKDLEEILECLLYKAVLANRMTFLQRLLGLGLQIRVLSPQERQTRNRSYPVIWNATLQYLNNMKQISGSTASVHNGIKAMLPVEVVDEDTSDSIDIETIKKLARLGCDVNECCNKTHRNALHEAAKYGDHKLCKLLLSLGAQTMFAFTRMSAWVEACSEAKDEQLTQLLFEHERCLLSASKKCWQMIYLAADGRTDCLKFLLQQEGDDFSATIGYQDHETTPLQEAIHKARFSTILLLIPFSRFYINQPCRSERSALAYALRKYNLDKNREWVAILDCLVKYGARVHSLIQDDNNVADFLCHYESLEWLVEQGIALNGYLGPNRNRCLFHVTLLHLIHQHYRIEDAESYRIKIVYTLLNHGMKIPDSKSQRGLDKESLVTRACEYRKFHFALFLYTIGLPCEDVADSKYTFLEPEEKLILDWLSIRAKHRLPSLLELSRSCIIGYFKRGYLPDLVQKVPLPTSLKTYLKWETFTSSQYWELPVQITSLGEAK